MKTLLFAVVALAVVAVGLFFSGVLTSAEPPKLRLQAVLTATGEDVTERVTWFVRRDGSWMGPEFATITDAVPGNYTATFQVLGADDFVADLSLGDGEGGTLVANLDATLIEVALPADNLPQQVSFRYEWPGGGGSQGVFVSDDGFARTLVSGAISKLELETEAGAILINADVTSGGVVALALDGGAIGPAE